MSTATETQTAPRFIHSVYPMLKLINTVIGRSVKGMREEHWIVISPKIIELDNGFQETRGSTLTMLGKNSAFSVWDESFNFLTEPVVIRFSDAYEAVKQAKKEKASDLFIEANETRENANAPLGWIRFEESNKPIPFWEYNGEPVQHENNGLMTMNGLGFASAMDIATTGIRIPNDRFKEVNNNNEDDPVFFRTVGNTVVIYSGTYSSISYGLVPAEFKADINNGYWDYFSIPYTVARSYVKVHELFYPKDSESIPDKDIVLSDNGGITNARFITLNENNPPNGYQYNIVSQKGQVANGLYDLLSTQMPQRQFITTFTYEQVAEELKNLYISTNTEHANIDNLDIVLTNEPGYLILGMIQNQFYYDQNGQQQVNQQYNSLTLQQEPSPPFIRTSINFQKFYKFINALKRHHYKIVNLYATPDGIVLENNHNCGIFFRRNPIQ